MADEPKIYNLPPVPPPNDIEGITEVVKIATDSQLPREYITSGIDINEALALTTLLDTNEQNDVTRLYAKLTRWGVKEGIDTLKFWLNARRTVGGYQLTLALMGHTQVVSPEAMGVKLNKQAAESLKKAQEAKFKKERWEQQNDQHPS